MSLGVESLRRKSTEALSAVKRAFSTSAEEFLKPSPVSFWISEQTHIPFRRALANLVEDARVSVFAPFNLARGMRENNQINGLTSAIFVGIIPLGMGMEMGIFLRNPLIGALAAGVLYMAEGYLLYRSCAANVAPYRQALNSP